MTHSTGVNWITIGVIAGIVIPIFGAIIAWQQKRANDIRDDIKEAVEHLGEVLVEKLETKENVAKISERLARMEERDRGFPPGRHRW